MKREEAIANCFLAKYFGKEPVFEPLGPNTPPDFCLSTTAFEVRRLNEHYFEGDSGAEGLEYVEYRLKKAISERLSEIPFVEMGGSFFWGLSYQRPLQAKVGKIAKELVNGARRHYSSGLRTRLTIAAFGIFLELIPSMHSFGRAFVSGYDSDEDSGGFIDELYRKNIQVALADKIRKTKEIREKFDPWVLILVDTIFPGTSWPNDMGSLNFELGHFRSIAILSWIDASLEFEWPKNSLKSMH